MQSSAVGQPQHEVVEVLVDSEDGALKVYSIWNQAYKRCYVVAADQVDALNLCAERKHIRRARAFRKFEDSTETLLAENPQLAEILARGTAGVLEFSDANGWVLVE